MTEESPAAQSSPTPAGTTPTVTVKPADYLAPTIPVAPTITAPAPAATPPVATPPVVAEQAEISLTVPAGTAVDPALVDRVKSLAKASGMSAPHAQAVLDSEVALQRQRDSDFSAAKVAWVETVKADPVLGGANYARTESRMANALSAFADPAWVKYLTDNGFIHEPGFVKAWAKVGEQMGDSKLAVNGQPLGAGKSIREQEYPNSAWMDTINKGKP